MKDRHTDPADADTSASEYEELVQLIVDSAWNPGNTVRTSQGRIWQFRTVPYTSDFPQTVERHASRPVTKATSAVERWRTVQPR